ncbi:MAG: helix-turn-helix transcriptional regulator [Peptococcaceae bacterium]|nr:helix-turn-helix transcriptional regulator [Peptococcaceae bacterium]
MRLPTFLRSVRKSRGETVTSMAKKLGIGVSRYHMIESGTRPASPEIAEAICRALSVPSEDIFLPVSFTVRAM